MTDDEMIVQEFEAGGEDHVRASLAIGRYAGGRRGHLAPIWLERQSRSRMEARNAMIDASQAEQIAISRSAARAAWEAARAANRANIIAIPAAIGAAIAIALSIWTLLRGH